MFTKIRKTIALCLAIMLFSASVGDAFAIMTGDWSVANFELTDATVTVSATESATATVSFTNKIAIELHSAINGTFSVKGYTNSECTEITDNITLTELNPAAIFTLGALDNNAVSSGSFSYMNSNSTDIEANTNLWSATYTVAANTPSGIYYVMLSPVAMSDLLDNTMSNETYVATITVTNTNETTEEPTDPAPEEPVEPETPPFNPVDVNYGAGLGSTATDVKVGETVSVTVLVGGTTKEFASAELNLTYEGLTFVNGSATTAADDPITIKGENGKIKIVDHGATTTWGENATAVAYTLDFTVDAIDGATGTASVTLVDAAFDTEENAIGANLTEATIDVDNKTKSFIVTPADLNVELDTNLFNGADTVEYGGNYTFTAKDNNYDYTVTVEGGSAATYDEETKTWTVAGVTSDLTITATYTGKKFDVAFSDMNHIEATTVAGEDAAQYKVDYTFTLKADEPASTGVSGWKYELESITIGNVGYTANNEDKTYTISGSDITGDIIITTKKTEVKPGDYTVTVNRTDVTADELTVVPTDVVGTGNSIALTLTPSEKFAYTVTYKIGDGTEQTVTWNDGENGTKTATIANVNGNVVINASKVADKNAITVSVGEYVALDRKTMYLVQVTGAPEAGYVYTYGGANMYWSEKYNNNNGAYAYLVIKDADDNFGVEDARVELDMVKSGGIAATTIAYDFNVNMSASDKVDANDAQLVWNMYSAKSYSDFTQVSMEKFLKADVETDGEINIDDAAAIVRKILENAAN